MVMFESVLVYVLLVPVINILSSTVFNDLELVLTSSSLPPRDSRPFIFSFTPLKSDSDFLRPTAASVGECFMVKNNWGLW